jgi:hypothetical protein
MFLAVPDFWPCPSMNDLPPTSISLLVCPIYVTSLCLAFSSLFFLSSYADFLDPFCHSHSSYLLTLLGICCLLLFLSMTFIRPHWVYSGALGFV